MAIAILRDGTDKLEQVIEPIIQPDVSVKWWVRTYQIGAKELGYPALLETTIPIGDERRIIHSRPLTLEETARLEQNGDGTYFVVGAPRILPPNYEGWWWHWRSYANDPGPNEPTFITLQAIIEKLTYTATDVALSKSNRLGAIARASGLAFFPLFSTVGSLAREQFSS